MEGQTWREFLENDLSPERTDLWRHMFYKGRKRMPYDDRITAEQAARISFTGEVFRNLLEIWDTERMEKLL